MIISELLQCIRVKSITGPLSREIKGIAYDSRLVGEDFLFVAVRGFSRDGHEYIRDALSRGAAAVIGEKAVETTNAYDTVGRSSIAYIEVSDSREALALISAAFYGHPSERLSIAGITGTNGKTTTSYITKNIINAGGRSAGLLGSVRYMTGDRIIAASNTTPESLDLQRYLSEMVNNKMEYAVLEVSSHALALRRVEGCAFNAAAFTNFSQDHLDFHGTMEEYFRAKTGLFDCLKKNGHAVLNHDDPMVRGVAEKLKCNVITCGLENGAMITAENIKEYGIPATRHRSPTPGTDTDTDFSLSFDIRTPRSRFRINSGLMGRFNVYNILIAAGIAYALGFSDDVIQKGIEEAEPVEGRFERIDEGQCFLCIVDYAHTEDALRNLLQEVRTVTRGRVITVFGCGGDRDRTKRPLMGAVASGLSDLAVVSSDNPRTENPLDIIRDIVRGIERDNYIVRPDREEAIREAVLLAEKGDTLVVAGKGHEDYQEIQGVRHHFSDKEILRKAIKKRQQANTCFKK